MLVAVRAVGLANVHLPRRASRSVISVRAGINVEGYATEAEHEDMVMRMKAKHLHLDQPGRHIFLCSDQSVPKCCSKDVSIESWEYLKNRLKELGVDHNGPVWRTKANCLRVCARGPIAVVFPGDADGRGVYYHSCTPAVLEKIIQTHLIGGEILEEYRVLPDNSSADTGSTSS